MFGHLVGINSYLYISILYISICLICPNNTSDNLILSDNFRLFYHDQSYLFFVIFFKLRIYNF